MFLLKYFFLVNKIDTRENIRFFEIIFTLKRKKIEKKIEKCEKLFLKLQIKCVRTVIKFINNQILHMEN